MVLVRFDLYSNDKLDQKKNVLSPLRSYYNQNTDIKNCDHSSNRLEFSNILLGRIPSLKKIDLNFLFKKFLVVVGEAL